MIMTTSNHLDNKKVTRYLGIVTGEAILGANIFKDFFAGIRDIVGGRAGAYEKELQSARKIAFEEMEMKATSVGANAIIAIDIDYETIGANGSMLMVSVTGTAVFAE
ncbi:MAG: heavy metal-binding domain-containing protein [Gracilimonas sp.]